MFLTVTNKLTQVAADSSTEQGHGATTDQRGILGKEGKNNYKKYYPLPRIAFLVGKRSFDTGDKITEFTTLAMLWLGWLIRFSLVATHSIPIGSQYYS